MRGEALAVVDGSEQVSYAELGRRVESQTRTLRRQSDGQPRFVTLREPRGIGFVVSLLALWSSGSVPVPLDPGIPQGRLGEIEDVLRVSRPAPNAAYAIATSGSSGRPKVVEILQDGLLPMLEAQLQAFGTTEEDRVLWMLSPGFDASLSDIGVTLLAGATLVCAPEDCGSRLPELMAEHDITQVDVPPALLALHRPRDFPENLRTLVVGGAPSRPCTLREWAVTRRVVSVYGPTEATVCSSLSVVDQSWDAPHLGRPIAGLRYAVRDGELCIGGRGVARGYLGAAASSAFWVEDGTRWYGTGDVVRESTSPHGLIFAGRKDRQVKLHGQRVELEEIEARLRPLLGDNVAAYLRGGQLAVAWEVRESRTGSEAKRAREVLEQTLPPAWWPRAWHPCDSLPRLSNGKVDYALLSSAEVALEMDSLQRAQRAVELRQAGLCWHLSDPETARTPSELRALARVMLSSAGRPPRRPSRRSRGERPRLLVTGASGRLGSALLPPLAEDFELLVLARNSVAFPGGVEVLRGDLTFPRLGLSPDCWEALHGRVDAVLNLAARVDGGSTLEHLLEINARPLLTLAELGVPIHHASSLAVLLSTHPRPVCLHEALESDFILGSYAQSKWVAERLWEAVGKGGTLFRYGLLSGSPRPDDLLETVKRGLTRLGCYPAREASRLAFDATPMDLAVELTRRHLRASSPGKIVAVSAGVTRTLQDLVDELGARGVRIRAVSLEKFLSRTPPDPCALGAQLAVGQQHPAWDLFLMGWRLAHSKAGSAF